MHRNTSVKIFSVHVHRRDLAVGICGVVINSTACITAGGVDRDLIFSIGYLSSLSAGRQILRYGKTVPHSPPRNRQKLRSFL